MRVTAAPPETLKDSGRVTSDLCPASPKIPEPDVDAEVWRAAVRRQQPAHVVPHLGCVEPGGLGRGPARWKSSCYLWTVRRHT